MREAQYSFTTIAMPVWIVAYCPSKDALCLYRKDYDGLVMFFSGGRLDAFGFDEFVDWSLLIDIGEL